MNTDPMLGLTLWRPWHCAILYRTEDPKRVENRPWAPWSMVIGKRIALHAGKRFEDDVADLLCVKGDPRAQYMGIVGTAVVRGWIHVSKELLLPGADNLTHSDTLTRAEAQVYAGSRWFFGPYGWVLEDVRVLPEPIPCRGNQALWPVPDEIAARLRG